MNPSLDKKKKQEIKLLHSTIRQEFAFNQIQTWNDLLTRLKELPIIPDKPLTYKELNEYLSLNTSGDRTNQPNQQTQQNVNAIQDEKIQKSTIQPNENIRHETDKAIRSGECYHATPGFPEDFDSTREVSPLHLEVQSCELVIPTGNENQSLIKPVPSAEVVTDIPLKLRNVTIPEPKFDASDNYGLKESPNTNPKLLRRWYQKKATAQLFHKIVVKRYPGVLFQGATGCGKTFIVADVLRMLEDIKFYENKTHSYMPMLYITKATILTQTHRVFQKYFNLKPNVDVEITNIETLRSTSGQYWLSEEKYIDKGVERWRWRWKPKIQPVPLVVDESQGTKNLRSQQAQAIYAYNNLPVDKRCLICVSATHFTRVIEAQAWACSTNADLSTLPGFKEGDRLNNETWKDFAKYIASPSKPDDYCEAAVKRLRDFLEEYIVQVKGIRSQFEPINKVEIIQFETPELREFYRKAWDRFLEENAKLDKARDMGKPVGACFLVVLLKYSMAAEFCHAYGFAKFMHEAWQDGKAGVCFVKFKQTLIEVVEILVNKFGYKREDISLIWGGGQTALTDKQKKKQKIKDLKEKLEMVGLSVDEMIGDSGLDDVEDRVIKDYPAWLKLGLQSKEERQSEIDRFESGKTKFAIYTLKSGGVGLSLQHTDEYCEDWNRSAPGFDKWKAMIDALPENQRPDKGKIRYKESGYAYEEDIPFVFSRPRRTCGCVTYNAIELVQGVGRVPRMNSLSVTEQKILCYAGTVEVQMGRVYTVKLRCIKSFIGQPEPWDGVVFRANKAHEEADKLIENSKGMADDESSIIDESENDE